VVRLFLARHGRTRLNAAGVLRGHLDPPLDAVGRFQALVLADVLAHQRLASIVSSPLLRARETAEPIGLRTGLPVEIDERLIDRDYGSWAGRSKEEVVARWGSVDNNPEIEPAQAVVDRAIAALRPATGPLTAPSSWSATMPSTVQRSLSSTHDWMTSAPCPRTPAVST
jgi:broad specificity phosphatase PhoE